MTRRTRGNLQKKGCMTRRSMGPDEKGTDPDVKRDGFGLKKD